jgi:Phage tail assembly chaperone proteins, E, or 41 or 14
LNKPEREGFVGDAETVVYTEPPPELPPAAKAEEPLPDTWPMVVKLMHRPVQRSVAADTVKELVFREPTARDIIRAGGNPVRVEVADVTGNQVTYNFRIDDAKMMRLMASLCGIVEPYLMEMDTRDYNSCAYRLQRFFIAEQGMW